MAEVIPKGTAQREGTTPTNENFPGKIVDYSFWMLKQGYSKGTIETRTKLMKRLARLGANVYEPESIKETIAKQTWSEGRKEIAIETYSNFLKMTGGTWDPRLGTKESQSCHSYPMSKRSTA